MPEFSIEMAGSQELEPTAALVMGWARDLYKTGCASRFCSRLDLSAGYRMKQECDSICPWYPEVMMNRKWFIRHLATEMLADSHDLCQVIILAAGKSPLALELLEIHPERIASVIETDIAWMEEKQEIYRSVAPGAAEKIRCLHADIYQSKETEQALYGTGMFDPEIPSIIVFEGISYYLSPAISSRILSLFSSESRQNRIILDSLLPCRLVRDDRRYISRGIWRVIHRDCNFRHTITYSPEEMAAMLSTAGCEEIRHHSMDEMERLRTGKSRYFPTGHDGWIRITTARI